MTSFRLIIIKKALFNKKSIRQSLPLLDLGGVAVTASKYNDSFHTVRIYFPELNVDVDQPKDSPLSVALVRAVLGVWHGISYRCPKQPHVSLPKGFLDGFDLPRPDVIDGMIASYFAHCNRAGVAVQSHVVEYLIESFADGSRIFDIGECVGYKEVNGKHIYNRCSMLHLQQIAAALRHSDWFHEVAAIGFPLLDEGVAGLGAMFQRAHVTRAAFAQVGMRSGGASALARVLSLGQHHIDFLNVSKNAIGDHGLRSLVDGLRKGRRPVRALCFQGCGVTAVGVAHLMELLRTDGWASGVEALDISDNRIRMRGTAPVAAWLKVANVAVVHLSRCDLDTGKIFEAILANRQSRLTTLSVAGNRIDDKKQLPLLQTLVRTTRTLRSLSLRKAVMGKGCLCGIITAAWENTCDLNLNLDASDCGIGESGSKALVKMFETRKKAQGGSAGKRPCRTNIATLNLSDNGLGERGMVNIIQALVGTDITSLILDRNFKSSLFKSGKQIGAALVRCVTEWPALRSLSVEGDDSYYLGKLALPILRALKGDTSITSLNMASNRLGDEGIGVLADALEGNQTLTSFNIDRNRITMQGLESLEAMCEKNFSLTDWVVPMEDITRIYKHHPELSDALADILATFEDTMERNAARAENKMSATEVPPSTSALSALVDPSASVSGEEWHEGIVTRRRKDTRLIGGLKSTKRFLHIVAGQQNLGVSAAAPASSARSPTAASADNTAMSAEAKAQKELMAGLIDKHAKNEAKHSQRAALPEGWGVDGDGQGQNALSVDDLKSTASIGPLG